MITTVLFDLDDTLFDFRAAERIGLTQTFEQCGIPATDELLSRFHEINRSLWQRLELGEVTREQVLVNRFSILFAEYGIDRNAEDVRRMYEECMSQCHTMLPGALELVQTLAERYRLYLITNGTARIQKRRLKSSPILPYFSEIFISQEVGFNKPDPRYFEHCFAHIPQFEKEKAVIIGDSLSSDILGGNAVGVRTCWYNPKHIPHGDMAQPDHEVHALSEIPALLLAL